MWIKQGRGMRLIRARAIKVVNVFQFNAPNSWGLEIRTRKDGGGYLLSEHSSKKEALLARDLLMARISRQWWKFWK